MTVQSDGPADWTLVTASASMGAVAGDHVVPASRVVTTTALPGSEAPVEPTAMQSVAVGHETPLNCGVLPPATCWAFHDFPPLVVATMTVAPVAGGFGPATPTAQHRLAVAHDTDPSSPVPLGAGCPTTRGVPFGSPRTWRLRALGVECPTSPQAEVMVASVPRRRNGPPCRGRASVEARNMEARQDEDSGGGRIFWCTVGYPRSGGSVDVLIIGLMLLAAVHGLRLGALVQLLTFGGFFLGFVLGTLVWVPLLSTGPWGPTRSLLVVSW